MTKRQKARQVFLAERLTGLGGTDIAAICGLHPYRSPLEVFLEKTGQLPAQEDHETLLWGRLLEDDVLSLLRVRHPTWIIRRPSQAVRHVAYPWAMGHIDADARNGADRFLIEIKTANHTQFDAWMDEPPMHYQVQAQWYMGLRGAPRAVIVVTLGGFAPKEYWLDRNPAVFNTLLERGREFWEEYVLRRVEPLLTGAPGERAALNILYPLVASDEPVALPTRCDTLVRAIRNHEAHQAVEDQRNAQWHNDLIEALQGHTVGLTPNGVRITYKVQSRKTVDQTALKTLYPQIATAVLHQTTHQVLRIHGAQIPQSTLTKEVLNHE